MFLCGAENLESNKAWINQLNVFPVPDGDTGTNMSMTVVSAVNEILNVDDGNDMRKVCKAISSGSLRGARGNSGVILSQLLRGFCKVSRDLTEIDTKTCAAACDKAVETAYKAVMKPKEGTILTVAKGIAQKARELSDAGMTDFDEFLPQVVSYADEVLATTPELLPVLKQAGVVDSGGQGLVQLIKGAVEGYQGKEPDIEKILHPEEFESTSEETAAEQSEEEKVEAEEKARRAKLKFGYVVSFVDTFTKTYNDKIDRDVAQYMQTIADEIVSIRFPDDTGMRVQMKTNDPGLVLQRALLYGQLSDVKIANLRCGEPYEELKTEESGQEKGEGGAESSGNANAAETAAKDISGSAGTAAGTESASSDSQTAGDAESTPEEMPHKDIGMIAVAAGDGLAEIFKGLGVDYVISGGQTMNPSTEDILNAVDRVNADTIFIMPNNKNIILAANQAAAISEDRKLVVIPTKTVPQGITAAINFIPDQSAELNEQTMKEEIARVKTCEVTYAVRDTIIDDIQIHQGDMMAIGDDGILNVDGDKNGTTLAALEKMVDDSTELVSIYYGADTTEEEAEALRDAAAEKYPNIDIELQNGGQPVYYYIVSAE